MALKSNPQPFESDFVAVEAAPRRDRWNVNVFDIDGGFETVFENLPLSAANVAATKLHQQMLTWYPLS